MFMKFTKDDLNKNTFNEEKLREEFERNKNSDDQWEINEEEENAVRIALIQEFERNSPNTMKEFHEILDEQFAIFKNHEKYDFVTDLHKGYSEALRKPLAE